MIAREALFEEIEKEHAKYRKFWEDVCNIESPTDFKEGVDKVGSYFADLAKKHGWQVELFEQENVGNVVCITMNADVDARPISLSGHIDTVHPVGLFGTPAVRFDEEKIYGPGVRDCKGGVVGVMCAMEALQKCGIIE